MKIKDFIKKLEGYPEDMEIFTRSDTAGLYQPDLEETWMSFFTEEEKKKQLDSTVIGKEIFIDPKKSGFVQNNSKIVLAILDKT